MVNLLSRAQQKDSTNPAHLAHLAFRAFQSKFKVNRKYVKFIDPKLEQPLGESCCCHRQSQQADGVANEKATRRGVGAEGGSARKCKTKAKKQRANEATAKAQHFACDSLAHMAHTYPYTHIETHTQTHTQILTRMRRINIKQVLRIQHVGPTENHQTRFYCA